MQRIGSIFALPADKDCMQKILLAYFLLATMALAAQSQPNSVPFKIDKGRVLFHDKVDKEQQRFLTLLQNNNSLLNPSADPTIQQLLQEAIINKTDLQQDLIENDSLLNGQEKVKYIRGLEILIAGYNNNLGKKDFNPAIAPTLLTAFEQARQLDNNKQSIEPVVVANNYAIGKILVECFLFPENAGVKPARVLLIQKYLALHPDEILPVLQRNPELPTADSLLVIAAKADAKKFYNYAAVRDRLGERIRLHTDAYVQTISKMAISKSGQLYFPFFDLLLHKKITYTEIDSVKEDNLAYYRLLVKTRIDFASRIMAPLKDTPMGMQELSRMMNTKAREAFVREINGLHDQPDAVRFKCLEPLSPQELYYLCVLSEDEIYTSSYLGVFKRIFQKMPAPRGDELIMSVNADYFRKFIKMAAAYNTLDTLLKSMPDSNATVLMKSFMIGLEKSTNLENVEDAVDVADSYSSIFDKNKKLAAFMLDEANWNYDRCLHNNDKNGMVVYNIERTLFESADTSSQVNLSSSLGIPPVFNVAYSSLTDDSGRVVQQVFFYGDEDKDGQNSFANFMTLFRGKPEWSIAENPYWVTIKSAKGKPVWIFANKPLYGEDDPDEEAQQKLNEYLADKKIHPSVFIHRGHSYHVKYSLQQIQPSARVVVLGSCGGYNNLNEVLTISSDAHIISSKQVGTRTVNEPILKAINTALTNGKNIDWLPMWKELGKQFTGDAKEKFDDYIPPYKNLGAIFIKAYRIASSK